MSCCGNNTVNNLKQIYKTPGPGPGPGSSVQQFNNNKLLLNKKSPFDNYITDYKPVLTANGKFVKYIREIRKNP